MTKGVSIIICCYNSSKLLPETLRAISLMSFPTEIKLEIIIVDNNSSDNTYGTAEEFFKTNEIKIPYRILKQNIQGLSYARKMGIDNAGYEYIILCDDDNLLNPDYAEISYRKMELNEKAGAMGGESEAVSEVRLPEWFVKFQKSYSAGKQYDTGGEVTWDNNALWGAGMVLRKSALYDLYSKGFNPILSDRKSSALTSGGDIELCYALRLAGWKIYYEPALKFRHIIPAERQSWEYLRKLSRGFGAQKAGLDPYLKAFESDKKNLFEKMKQSWYYQSFQQLIKLRKYGIRKLLNFKDSWDADPEILNIEKTIGKLTELLKLRSLYNIRMNSVKNAPWRRIHSKSKA